MRSVHETADRGIRSCPGESRAGISFAEEGSSGRRSPARPLTREFDIQCDPLRVGQRIDIAVRSDGNQVSISFTNYGDPIPERDLPFIFDRFYRVEASRSKQTGGTGLGLAITKSIVEVQGGEIRVRSDRRRTTLKRGF